MPAVTALLLTTSVTDVWGEEAQEGGLDANGMNEGCLEERLEVCLPL